MFLPFFQRAAPDGRFPAQQLRGAGGGGWDG